MLQSNLVYSIKYPLLTAKLVLLPFVLSEKFFIKDSDIVIIICGIFCIRTGNALVIPSTSLLSMSKPQFIISGALSVNVSQVLVQNQKLCKHLVVSLKIPLLNFKSSAPISIICGSKVVPKLPNPSIMLLHISPIAFNICGRLSIIPAQVLNQLHREINHLRSNIQPPCRSDPEAPRTPNQAAPASHRE